MRIGNDHVEADRPHAVDIDERVNVVEHVIISIDRKRTQILDRPYEAQIISNLIFVSCVGIVAEPVRLVNYRIEAR